MTVLENVGLLTVFTLAAVGALTVAHFCWRGHQQWLAEREELKAIAEREAKRQSESNRPEAYKLMAGR